ncbi:MAG: tetratricopeptide repeat protein [Erythrobacter sp.]
MALNLTRSSSKGPTGESQSYTPSHEDEILIREIDEAVRQDDALNFAKKYGPAVLGAVVLGLAGLGGYLWWDASRESKLESQSETIISALDLAGANDFRSAGEKVEPLIADGSPAARTAARFIQAGAALEAGNDDKAIAIFAAIVADEKAPQALRDLALVREVAVGFDNRKPADVIARLKPVAVPGHPLFGSAGELTAMAHLEAGNRREAGALFAAIAKDEALPETLRSRARQMAGLLGVDAIVDVTKLLKDEGVIASERAGGRAGSGAPAE